MLSSPRTWLLTKLKKRNGKWGILKISETNHKQESKELLHEYLG